jgi:type II secretory pathway pseudopilin PulG
MRYDRRRQRRGAVLLEAMAALAILASAAVVMVSFAAENARAVERARGAETEMRAANTFFSAVALWSRDDLDRHLGDRHQGHWIMNVARGRPTLYVVTLSDSTRRTVILRTSLYRPDTAHATP